MLLVLSSHHPRREGILNSVSLVAFSPHVSGKIQLSLKAQSLWLTICSIPPSAGVETTWSPFSEDLPPSQGTIRGRFLSPLFLESVDLPHSNIWDYFYSQGKPVLPDFPEEHPFLSPRTSSILSLTTIGI